MNKEEYCEECHNVGCEFCYSWRNLFALEEAAAKRRIKEAKLKEAGFEIPTDEERRERLALNIALLDWPK
jgi:hypothetical protein